LSIQRIGRHHAVAWVDHRGVEHDLSWKVEDLERELAEARRREAATNEVLGVISSSPTDVQPVFMTIVRSAVRLCDGLFSGVYHFDGELLHHIAHHNYSPEAGTGARSVCCLALAPRGVCVLQTRTRWRQPPLAEPRCLWQRTCCSWTGLTIYGPGALSVAMQHLSLQTPIRG
jgi:hypothetical protein